MSEKIACICAGGPDAQVWHLDPGVLGTIEELVF